MAPPSSAPSSSSAPASSSALNAAPVIARELELPERGVAAVLALLDSGATVPFIARYRKEATGDLDEVAIRSISERRLYLEDLESRRKTILASIAEQGALAPELEARVRSAMTKAELEDLYLPYKPKRRTRAAIARERGLAPLAERILLQPRSGNPEKEASAFVSEERGVPDVAAALAGARDIVAERVAENADVRATARADLFAHGVLVSRAASSKATERTKFEQYYDHREPLRSIPSHRFLAIRRGEGEGILKTKVELDADRTLARIARLVGAAPGTPFAKQFALAIQDAYDRLIEPSVASDVLAEVKARSDASAVEVFAHNLESLLLAPPLGERRVVGIDPGIRTGNKCVAVDGTGRFIENVTLFLSQGPKAEEKAREAFLAFVRKHRPEAIGVGNGTGGRETESFVRRALSEAGEKDIIVVSVNEAGASVYSASDVAREEFADLDVTVRGAISIARRLQDPLAELVKIDPKSIGVGQYQHDVSESLLTRKLDEVVESCVNRVGVEVNTASARLLEHVAGIGPALAKKIVKHREAKGAFTSRARLLDVSGLGPRAFEQCAGFLRVRGGAHALDASAVHPERYGLVERIASDLGIELAALVGDAHAAERIALTRYVGDGVGEPTLRDIISELVKPGRDPRASFEPPKFRDDVSNLEDLRPGMELEGIVTNVTAFGAFVDVGVHQDGLVHVSQLADRFVRDPHEVVKAGDRLRVFVLEVDLARRRIALSAKNRAKALEANGDRGLDASRATRRNEE